MVDGEEGREKKKKKEQEEKETWDAMGRSAEDEHPKFKKPTENMTGGQGHAATDYPLDTSINPGPCVAAGCSSL